VELRGEEGRRRLPVDLPATIAVAGESPRLGRVVNLTLSGAFVATAAPVPPGAAVALDLRLPLATGVRPVTVGARVRWTNEEAAPRSTVLPPGMGVQFVAVSLGAWDALLAFVAERLAAPVTARAGRGRRGW
jgi:hypothetical protein